MRGRGADPEKLAALGSESVGSTDRGFSWPAMGTYSTKTGHIHVFQALDARSLKPFMGIRTADMHC